MFYFNHEKFDFWEIYQSIIRYYPIGIRKDESNLFLTYPGIKELEKIVADNLHNTSRFMSTWGNFVKGIEADVQQEIIETTYGQAPSFSSYVLLDTTVVDNLTRTKEIHFFVSLIGPFYTVIGQDVNSVNIDNSHCRSTNYLVTSPENEFAATFTILCDKIEAHFEGFRFVPYALCEQSIDGLTVRYSDGNNNTIFNSLFNDLINLSLHRKIGNCYFKAEDWIKEDYVDKGDGWTSYPPVMHEHTCPTNNSDYGNKQ